MVARKGNLIGIFDIFHQETPCSEIKPILLPEGDRPSPEILPYNYSAINEEIRNITKDNHASLNHFTYLDFYNPNGINNPPGELRFTSFIYVDLERPEVEDNIIKIMSHLEAPIRKILFIFQMENNSKHSARVEECVNNFTKFKIIINKDKPDLLQFAIKSEEPYVKTIQL
jgi:hypothetical protein